MVKNRYANSRSAHPVRDVRSMPRFHLEHALELNLPKRFDGVIAKDIADDFDQQAQNTMARAPTI